jgi:hypothetical protein
MLINEQNTILCSNIEEDIDFDTCKNSLTIRFLTRAGKQGIARQGKLVFKPVAEKIMPFPPDGITPFKVDGKWGLVKYDGAIITSPKFSQIDGPYYQSFAVNVNDKWGLISLGGTDIVEPKYLNLEISGDGLFRYKAVNGKYGFLSHDGTIISKPVFSQTKSFSCGYAPVISKNLWGYIDKHGKYAVRPKYKHAWEFDRNVARATTNETSWLDITCFDTNFKEVSCSR